MLRHTATVSRLTAYVAVWTIVAFLAGLLFFLSSSRTVVLASHDAQVSPDLGGHVVVHTGPVLPDFRLDTGNTLGVDIRLGKTEARSTDDLVRRYISIAGQPDSQVDKVKDAVADMAWDAALRGAVVGLVPILVWLLLGRRRRRDLGARALGPQGALAGLLVVFLVLMAWQPWTRNESVVESEHPWMSLGDFVGPDVTLPEEAAGIEVRGDVTTDQTRRLLTSAISKYESSKSWYVTAATDAAALDLHQPSEGETVVVLVADRHDNIGMDQVARALGDAAGATAVFDAGDDTSAGKSWEEFSLDSVTQAFDGLRRYGVAGNHDHGTFVSSYLDSHGWTMMDGEVIDGPDGATLLGVDDPRSSGLGAWRDETGLSFDEVGQRLSDVACASPVRVSTMLVHDADLAADALARGCVDLVLAGHLHVQEGPTRVVGSNGQVGYSYTTGTAGGAAYAIAIGGKPRRDAQISLVTYRDGRPVGIQPVTLRTTGEFHVAAYIPLVLTPSRVETAQK
ncbi:putative phosphodiesterase [Nocardioides ginsengisegetis]|uniref:Putative phosphodiesterase n=1 Tax=Nocardioides ginsengisegetis TaxID=661491 RepID=A0A7W3IWF3_9ACTN|nr:putative phosphodiesterase [Nocardioides ginsengisegetis]